jgi:beta-glucosidase
MGAFENPVCVDIFLNFVKKVTEEFGDIVSEYITINEPNVYAVLGHFFGEWPPGKKSYGATVRVLNNMCKCHIKAYELIHSVRRGMGKEDTMVSYAHHMRVFEPKNKANIWHRISAGIMHRVFQTCISKSYLTGKACFPLRRVKCTDNLYCDFHAINYYTRAAAEGLSETFYDNVPVNDLGWEIYPEGIVYCAQELCKLAELPVYITENGTCDNTDAFRSRYIYEHIKALTESGLQVKRYYHWCFTDNFEWVEGVSARFGVVHVDYSNQKRTVKRSGEFFSKMIQERGVTQELYDEYCAVEYNISGKSGKA